MTGSSTYLRLGRWLDVELLSVHFGLQFDSLTVAMLVLVSVVSALVHVFSTGYLEGDPHLPRFMSYLSLFTFLMVVLVTSDNFLQLFIGWEGVGLCSYLLISFWFTRVPANKAAVKAILINRVGDSGLLLGMLLILKEFGTLDFVGLVPAGHDPAFITIICLLLFIGSVGKSAQLGLHSWLPDAMEGPTPVSALIHAATMVTAGVFLIIRANSLFEASPFALAVVTTLGAITAFFAATVGAVQSDLKKIVAYSTCSQLGYMVMVCGLSNYSVGLFHLVNHGFFKALLFLGAGSVVHAAQDEQDLRKFGGLLGPTPLTYVFLLIGSLSLAGFPFLTGFYSKDLIIELTFGRYYLIFAFWFAGLAAFFTAYYSARLLLLTFVVRTNAVRVSFSAAGDPGWRLILPLVALSGGSLFLGYFLREAILSSWLLPFVPGFVKLLPLFLVGLGFSLAFFFLGGCPRNPLFQALFSFLASAWGFNYLVNHWVVRRVFKLGYLVSYRIVDRGLLESLGPSGLSALLRYLSQRLSRLQSGVIFNYALIFIVFSVVFLALGFGGSSLIGRTRALHA